MARTLIPKYSDQWIVDTEISLPEMQAEFTTIYQEINRSALQADLVAHTSDKNNPHEVTAVQLGAANILAQVKNVDGAGSGLDADLIRGESPSVFARAATAALKTDLGFWVFDGTRARLNNIEAFRNMIDAELGGEVLWLNFLQTYKLVAIGGTLETSGIVNRLNRNVTLGHNVWTTNSNGTSLLRMGRITRVVVNNAVIESVAGYRRLTEFTATKNGSSVTVFAPAGISNLQILAVTTINGNTRWILANNPEYQDFDGSILFNFIDQANTFRDNAYFILLIAEF